ncbi:MAG TPA: hypothetical protein VHF45_06565 [Thermoleophilaceae bacterium]|nr:hypothetical protein [Thermoleophilaceae bacterium]
MGDEVVVARAVDRDGSENGVTEALVPLITPRKKLDACFAGFIPGTP